MRTKHKLNVQKICAYILTVTFSKCGCSVCFPLLLLCLQESLLFPASLLVCWISPELCLCNFESLADSLGVGGRCEGTGFFLAFFLSRPSVELLELL